LIVLAVDNLVPWGWKHEAKSESDFGGTLQVTCADSKRAF